MDIAIDVRSLIPPRRSGIERYTFHIVRSLLAVAPHHTYHLFYNAARAVERPRFAGPVEWHGFRYPNKVFTAAQWGLGWPRWDRLVRSVDCFFVPNLGVVPLSDGVPLVTTVHDLSYEYFPEFFSWRRRLWHRLVGPRQLLNRSQHLIAVSQATAWDIAACYGIAAERISVVSSGVSQPEHAVWQRPALPERYLLSFGVFEPRKNIDGIIVAFEAVADFFPHHLVIAGSAGWLMGATKRRAAASRYRERIHFVGAVTEAEQAALYRGADLFVYPSFYEGFGFPPLEALLAGTPVITSRHSALPEIVGEWVTMVNPYDSAELALVLREALRAPQRIPPAVQRVVQQRYSWDQAARQTVAILERVV